MRSFGGFILQSMHLATANTMNRLIASLLLCVVGVFGSTDTDWWKHTSIYELIVASFKDSNGDGIGDLRGVISKLDHLVDLHIDTIYFVPLFKSPKIDFGYDVADYVAIDELYGTMNDFDQLMKESKAKGIKVVLDLVINHCSDQHQWFRKSVQRIDPYTDYFIWKDPRGYDESGTPIPPNNWRSAFGGSAWKWNEERKQFYYHFFFAKQVDLNLRNENVKKEIREILKFWFDKGVAGFRLDAPMYYMEDKHFRNEVKQFEYTIDQWESFEYIHELRTYIDEYNKENGDFERILFAEIYADRNKTMIMYGGEDFALAHFPINTDFATLKTFPNANDFKQIMYDWLDNTPPGAVPNWSAENHDLSRIGTRLNEQYADILTTTIMTLPGIVFYYYGQEIGMQDGVLFEKQIIDFTGYSRDCFRLPMQWDDSVSAGFSSNFKTHLPVNPDYYMVNVQKQKKEKISKYNMFKSLSKLRKTSTMKYGELKSYVISEWVLAFTRIHQNHRKYVIVLNLGSATETVDLRSQINDLPEMMKVSVSSVNTGYKKGDNIRSSSASSGMLTLRPFSSIVLSYR